MPGWWEWKRGRRFVQWKYQAVAFCLSFLVLTCGLACNRRSSPQVAFDRVYKTFLHGDLEQSQHEAHRECQEFRDANQEWAWKFRILEAESLLWRGMSQEALTLLTSQSTPPQARDSTVEMLTLEGVAYAHLRLFSDAERTLEQAQQLCAGATTVAVCGNVIRANGVLAIERGNLAQAQQFFAQSLSFARLDGDRFLEATALLNLGAASLKEEHFDEAIDRSAESFQLSTALDAGDIVLVALENLGWAYYKLGDSEKALELFLDAEKSVVKLGDIGDQVSLLTDIG
jgi:tetratricopeptide (TPR) repeat protein